MTPKEKAKELVNEMYTCYQGQIDKYTAKQCALIAVDEIIRIETHHVHHKWVEYWKEVKHEIEKL